MQLEFLALILGLTACAAHDKADDVKTAELQCEFVGLDKSEAASGDVCAMFRDAANTSGRDDLERVTVTMLSATQAKAIAYAANDTVVGELNFDVMDAEIRPAMWQGFAKDFGQYLASSK